MKKLIIILSLIFILGCKKDTIMPAIKKIPDIPQYNNKEEKATLIISGDITDTIVYTFSTFDDIYKDAVNNFTILKLDIGDYMSHRIQCYMPIDTIGVFECTFEYDSCDEGFFNYFYTFLPDVYNETGFIDGNMTGEITKYGKVWDMIEGVVSGSLYNDSFNIDFELNFCMNREKDYYY